MEWGEHHGEHKTLVNVYVCMLDSYQNALYERSNLRN